MICGIINPYRNASASWQTVFTTGALVSDQNSWTNTTLRVRLIASGLTDLAGAQIRLTMQAGSTEGLTITKTRFGLMGAVSPEFASTPVSVTWDGGSASTTISANTQKTCDPFAFTYDGTSDLVVAFYTNGGSSSDMYRYNNVAATWGSRWKSGDDADTVGALSGYTNIAMQPIVSVEAFG